MFHINLSLSNYAHRLLFVVYASWIIFRYLFRGMLQWSFRLVWEELILGFYESFESRSEFRTRNNSVYAT